MHRDAAVGGLLALLSVFLLWRTGEIPHPPLVPIGPAFYPRVVLVVFLVLSLVLLAAGLRAGRPGGAWDWRGWLRRHRLILASFGLFALYTVLMPLVGYLVVTTLYAAAMQRLLGRRRPLGIAAVALGTAVGTWLVFERYLYVLLPRGTLWP